MCIKYCTIEYELLEKVTTRLKSQNTTDAVRFHDSPPKRALQPHGACACMVGLTSSKLPPTTYTSIFQSSVAAQLPVLKTHLYHTPRENLASNGSTKQYLITFPHPHAPNALPNLLSTTEWDRKATKARARKFKAKGKDLPEEAARKQKEKDLAKRARRAGGGAGQPGDAAAAGGPRPGARKEGEESDLDSEDDLSEDDEEEESEDEMGGIYLGKNPPPPAAPPAAAKTLDPTPAEAKSGATTAAAAATTNDDDDEDSQNRSKFSRRKLISNAYRYELPSEDDDPSNRDPHAPPPEPEPDYVALTANRVSALEAEEERRKAAAAAAAANLDAEFLRDLDSSLGGGQGKKKVKTREQEEREEEERKKHVVKVDKKEFLELQEKIKKRENVEAFRKRFESGTGAGKVKRKEGGGGVGGGAGLDDVDAFLEDLGLDGMISTYFYSLFFLSERMLYFSCWSTNHVLWNRPPEASYISIAIVVVSYRYSKNGPKGTRNIQGLGRRRR